MKLIRIFILLDCMFKNSKRFHGSCLSNFGKKTRLYFVYQSSLALILKTLKKSLTSGIDLMINISNNYYRCQKKKINKLHF